MWGNGFQKQRHPGQPFGGWDEFKADPERDALDAAKYRFLRADESAPLAVTLNKRVLRGERLDDAVGDAMAKAARRSNP